MLDDLVAIVHTHPLTWAVVGAVTLALVLGLGLWWHFRRRGPHRSIRRTLRRLGLEYRADVLLPDDVDGWIHVSYLVLTPGGILVLDVRDYEGALFGGEHIDLWTQLNNGASHRFPNPLRDNAYQVEAVRTLVPDVAVSGRVVFSDRGYFPKGRADGVSMVSTLNTELDGVGSSAQSADELKAVWASLEGMIETPDARSPPSVA